VRATLHKPVSPAALLGWFEQRAETAATAAPFASAELPRPDDLAGLRLLVAEDNLVNQRVILQMVRKLGCTTEVVMAGAQALAAAERADYDVILMDMQMPEMDGYEATRLIRVRLPAERQPHIISLTANALVGDREKCLAAGTDDYLAKPVTFTTLVPALQRARRRPSAAAAVALAG
jgi:CheY-like chemotaxis protein